MSDRFVWTEEQIEIVGNKKDQEKKKKTDLIKTILEKTISLIDGFYKKNK